MRWERKKLPWLKCEIGGTTRRLEYTANIRKQLESQKLLKNEKKLKDKKAKHNKREQDKLKEKKDKCAK
jgi:hypothetical protein